MREMNEGSQEIFDRIMDAGSRVFGPQWKEGLLLEDPIADPEGKKNALDFLWEEGDRIVPLLSQEYTQRKLVVLLAEKELAEAAGYRGAESMDELVAVRSKLSVARQALAAAQTERGYAFDLIHAMYYRGSHEWYSTIIARADQEAQRKFERGGETNLRLVS
jgi:hypothetical protein